MIFFKSLVYNVVRNFSQLNCLQLTWNGKGINKFIAIYIFVTSKQIMWKSVDKISIIVYWVRKLKTN